MTGGELRIASYNVHACIGTDGRFDPARIARVIAALDADIVVLQEVEDRPVGDGQGGQEGQSRDRPVSAFLADELGLQALPGPTLKRGDADYGNLLLSRHEPLDARTHDLAYPGREPRGAIEARFDIAGSRLRVIATHFGLAGAERRLQLGKLWPRLTAAGAEATVLCADLNEWLPVSRVHRALRGHFGATPAPNTFPSRLPLLGLDRIYVAPRRALRGLEAIRTPATRVASDHLPLVATLDPGSFNDDALTRP